jgi:pilus assembly protein Flp/PilA
MLTSFMPLVQSLIARVSMLRNESGQALVEYGLLVGLIAVVCVALIVTLGGDISSEFSKITSALGA